MNDPSIDLQIFSKSLAHFRDFNRGLILKYAEGNDAVEEAQPIRQLNGQVSHMKRNGRRALSLGSLN